MSSVKTAISLPESLLEQVETLAKEMKLSRSRLIALALEEFVYCRANHQLLEKINAAYSDTPTSEEQTILRSMRHQQRQVIEGEW